MYQNWEEQLLHQWREHRKLENVAINLLRNRTIRNFIRPIHNYYVRKPLAHNTFSQYNKALEHQVKNFYKVGKFAYPTAKRTGIPYNNHNFPFITFGHMLITHYNYLPTNEVNEEVNRRAALANARQRRAKTPSPSTLRRRRGGTPRRSPNRSTPRRNNKLKTN